jgi:hypothetical protein
MEALNRVTTSLQLDLCSYDIAIKIEKTNKKQAFFACFLLVFSI